MSVRASVGRGALVGEHSVEIIGVYATVAVLAHVQCNVSWR